MRPAHRQGDSRVCDAITEVVGQSTVFVNDLLWAVQNDPDTHGDGGLIPTGTTVFIEDKLVIVHTPDHAQPDDLCPFQAIHCDPMTAQGSGDTFAY
jgi:hypothetical protein